MSFKGKVLGIARVLLFVLLVTCQFRYARAQGSNVDLPSGKRWTVHVYRDLAPYWTTPDATGAPHGNFPTFRYNDGQRVDPAGPLIGEYKQLGDSNTWITNRLSRNYVRMLSRQTYAYCVAYHLTGDTEMLRHAKAGVERIFSTAMEPDGGFVSWFENGAGHPKKKQRTSQDLSYALVGPAFYYYLTRDKEVLGRLIRAKKYIFAEYGDPKHPGRLRWVNAKFNDPPEKHLPTQVELVAPLDQINAYMLLMTPGLPPSVRREWQADLSALAHKIKDDFYSPRHNVFWGRINDPASKQLEGHHVDFGHTIKSFWMLYLIGNYLNEDELTKFALANAPKVLAEAYLPDLGAWGEKRLKGQGISRARVWWIYAELDQMAATLSLYKPLRSEMMKYLPSTYRYWFDKMVDHRQKEVWHMIADDTGTPQFPKSHLWKSGFHSFEHALVGYITSQGVQNKPVELYYAFGETPEKSTIRPHYFQGDVSSIEESCKCEGIKTQRVTFSKIGYSHELK